MFLKVGDSEHVDKRMERIFLKIGKSCLIHPKMYESSKTRNMYFLRKLYFSVYIEESNSSICDWSDLFIYLVIYLFYPK